ncbi:unnamed protein product [Cylindrotheca closterium]|uniref:Chalcone isomerase domain-containing protein n=1 Tax=Cylindrotheca closterium TaxID=2856 RepID=A0AAD2FQQ0_9STRA|nr:unnamed protein product [Cylindrotheca closterium]
MFTSSSRTFNHLLNKRIIASHGRRWLSTEALATSRAGNKTFYCLLSGGVGLGLLMQNEPNYVSMAARVPSSGDVLSVGMPVMEEATGIAFPQLCNGFRLVGQGVRVKYVFVKVYAVGTYMDPVAMMAVKKGSAADIQKALLDPTYPRTIRIVMNRGLSIEKYTSAIVEALEPRMKGEELEKLEEFKKLNPSVDLVEGAEIEMTIRGDTLLYKNAVGGVGSLQSQRFVEALCDVYYGEDPASPSHKDSVLEGVCKL